MTARISKFLSVAVGQPKDTTAIAYSEVQVLALATGKWPTAAATSDLRLSEFQGAVVGKPKEGQSLNYAEAQVLAESAGTWPLPGDISKLQLTRFNATAIGRPKESQSLNYAEAQVLAEATGKWPPAAFISQLQLSRFLATAIGKPLVGGSMAYVEVQALGKGVPPAAPIPVPALFDLLRHNWVARAEITTTWNTDVVQSASNLSEERRGLVSRPYRMVQFEWTGMAQGASARMLLLLARLQDERFVVPLYPDVSHTTAASSGTVLNCPTEARRFQAGGYLVVFEVGSDCAPINAQVREIDVVGSESINLTTSLSGSFPAGSFVVPVLYSEVMRNGMVRHVTDAHGAVSLSVEEVVGNTALLPLASGSGGASEFEGDPVFPYHPHWGEEQQVGVKRPGLSETLGRGTSVFLRGQRPLFQFTLSLRGMSRPEVFGIVSFFDARRGRLLPFWLPNPAAGFEVVTWGLAQVDVRPSGQLQNVTDYLSVFAVVLDSGQVILRRASAILQVGDIWRIGFTAPLPAEALNYSRDVRRFTSAHLVRFSSDSLTERWITNEVADLEIGCEEILVEEDIVLAVDLEEPDFEIPLTETPREEALNGQLWLSAFSQDLGLLTLDGSDRVESWADKYGAHGGVSQASAPLRPLYDPTAFGGRGGVVFDGNVGEFLAGVAPLSTDPVFVMGVFELDGIVLPATAWVMFNNGDTNHFYTQRFTGTNAVSPATTNPAMRVEARGGVGSPVLGGDTLGLNPDYAPGDPAYLAGVPFAALLTSFTDTLQTPFQRNIFGRIRNPTTGTNDTLFGGRAFAPETTYPLPVGIDSLRIGLPTTGAGGSAKLTIGELIFFSYQPANAALQGSDFLTNQMFDYFAARWPIQ